MLTNLTKASFDPHLNSKFEIQTEEGLAVETELVEITEKNSEQVKSFSLILRGDKNRILPQGTHKINHDKMGELNLFLTPIMHPKQDGMYYQIIFNKLIKKKGGKNG